MYLSFYFIYFRPRLIFNVASCSFNVQTVISVSFYNNWSILWNANNRLQMIDRSERIIKYYLDCVDVNLGVHKAALTPTGRCPYSKITETPRHKPLQDSAILDWAADSSAWASSGNKGAALWLAAGMTQILGVRVQLQASLRRTSFVIKLYYRGNFEQDIR